MFFHHPAHAGIHCRREPFQSAFAGSDYDHARDAQRLERQHERVLRVMQDGQQHALAGISEVTGDPPASVSAQLRHLRRPEFGGHQIEKTYLGAGLYAYQLKRAQA